MKRLLVLVIAAAAAALPLAGRAAAPAFSDRLCNLATNPVIQYNAQVQNPNALVDDVIGLAEKVVTAYDQCATDMASNNGNDITSYSHEDLVETMHYAQMQSARYRFAIGHLQHLMQRDVEARAAFEGALKIVNDIIGWRSPAQSYYSSNDVNVGSGSGHNGSENYSNYRTAAMQVRDAIQKELDSLDKLPAPAPSTAPK